MLNKDVYSFLGLCQRARKLSYGSQLIEDIRHQKVYFVIISSNASDNTKKKISDKCNYYQIDYIIDGNSEMLSYSIGKDNRIAIGISDKGFANKIKTMIGG